MKKLLFLLLAGCSTIFQYQDLNVYNISFSMKDPYTLHKNTDKTTVLYKDIVISVIKLDNDPQTAMAYANAIASRLLDKDNKVSVIEYKTNKNNIKYVYFTSNSDDIVVQYAIIKYPNAEGYIVACNKKEYNEDNLCDIVLESIRVK